MVSLFSDSGAAHLPVGVRLRRCPEYGRTVADDVAAAGLVDEGQRGRQQAFVVDDALDAARGFIVAAAGRGWHDDFDVLRGLPLCVRVGL